MRRTRRIAPWILLAAYLPLVLASMFHSHALPDTSATSCPDCVRHVAHPAHFSDISLQSHDCLLCQLLSVVYIGIAAAVVVAVMMVVATVKPQSWRHTGTAATGLSSLRAPPIC